MNLMFSWENKRRKYNKRLPFTEEEDQKLLKIISNTMNKGYDSNEQIREDLIDWKIISKEMGNRSVRQCKERYFHYLSPQINKKDWTPEEDSLLFSTVGNIGKKWKIMEDLFENRTEIDIRNRYYVLQRKKAKDARKASKNNVSKLSNASFNITNFRINSFDPLTFHNNYQEEEENKIEKEDQELDEIDDAFTVPNECHQIDAYANLMEFFKDLNNETFEKYYLRGSRHDLFSFFNGRVYDYYYINNPI